MMRRRRDFILSLALILAGGMIYVLFRPRTTLLFVVIDAIGLGRVADVWRLAVADISLPELMINSLPDGLWSTAYVLVIDGLFLSCPASVRLKWASVIPLIGAVSELLQCARLLPGTFDLTDFLFYVTPFLVYLCIIKKRTRYEN